MLPLPICSGSKTFRAPFDVQFTSGGVAQLVIGKREKVLFSIRFFFLTDRAEKEETGRLFMVVLETIARDQPLSSSERWMDVLGRVKTNKACQ